MPQVPVTSRSYSEVYAQLDKFDPKKDLITSDLKVVKKRSFSTWMGRVFTPQKYRLDNVAHSLHKYIEKNGRRGLANLSDGEIVNLKETTLAKCSGLNRFFQKLSNASSMRWDQKGKHLENVANKLNKLLYTDSKYLDTPSANRSTLSSLERLKGRVIEIDLSKPTKAIDTQTHLETAFEGVREAEIQPKNLEAQATRIQRGISIVHEILEIREKTTDLQNLEYVTSSAYSKIRDKHRLNSILPADFTDYQKDLTAGLAKLLGFGQPKEDV